MASIALLETGVLVDLNALGKHEEVCRSGFHLVLNILAVDRSWEIDRDSFVDVGHPCLGYDLSSRDVRGLLLSRLAKHFRC